MRRYIIELRGKQSQTDFSLNVLRLGKRIRIQLQMLNLPEPLLYADPETDETVAQFFIDADRSQQVKLTQTCQDFETRSRQKIRCSIYHAF